MSLSIETMASRISLSTSFSGRWSLISWCVRKPRVLPILMRVFSSWRRLATSSSVSAVSSSPNSRISARSLARLTFMRSGLTFSLTSPSSPPSAASASGSASISASTSEKSSSTISSFFSSFGLRPRLPLPSSLAATAALAPGFFFSSTAMDALAAVVLVAGAAAGFLAVMRILGRKLREIARNGRSQAALGALRAQRQTDARALGVGTSTDVGQARSREPGRYAALAGKGWPSLPLSRVAGARRCCCHSCRCNKPVIIQLM